MKVVTVGSATIDVIATIANDDIEQMKLTNQTASFLLMEPGRKVDAQSVVTFAGGGAVNAAVSFARQGFDVAALVKLGCDINAEKLKERLVQEGIDTSLIRTHATQSTATSLLITSHDRDASIFTHRGANGYLEASDYDDDTFTGVDLVYLTNLSNASVEHFPALVRKAKAAGAFVAANPGVRQLTLKTDPFFDSLADVDLFICNASEARALVPKLVERTGWDSAMSGAVEDGRMTLEIEGFRLPLHEYFKRLHSLGLKYVGVTDGGRGAHLSGGGEVIFQPVIPVAVEGTTGAGDAFASTLSGALVRGSALRDALAMAAHNAASVVSVIDAQSGLLTEAELEDRIRQDRD